MLTSWLILVLSGVCEAVWATALGKTSGFTRLTPTLVFAVALVASMAGLAYAMRSLPISTAYAIWVGVGAVLTVAYAMTTGDESVSTLKVVCLILIIGGVIGLKAGYWTPWRPAHRRFDVRAVPVRDCAYLRVTLTPPDQNESCSSTVSNTAAGGTSKTTFPCTWLPGLMSFRKV